MKAFCPHAVAPAAAWALKCSRKLQRKVPRNMRGIFLSLNPPFKLRIPSKPRARADPPPPASPRPPPFPRAPFFFLAFFGGAPGAGLSGGLRAGFFGRPKTRLFESAFELLRLPRQPQYGFQYCGSPPPWNKQHPQ